MKAEVIKTDSLSIDSEVVRQAAACLANGGLVVFPTETVYGIGANAADPAAVARLREVKQRSDAKPFTVHVGSRADVDSFVPDLAGVGRRLIDKALPGPLTLILDVKNPQRAAVLAKHGAEHADAMYHDGTIGLRCPDDAVAARILSEADVPIVAASANPAGAPPPTDVGPAVESLGNLVDLIVDAGQARYARASTIVRVTDEGYEILREGVIDERTLRRLMRVNFLLVCSGNTCRSPMAVGLLRRLLAGRLGCGDDELTDRGYHVESAGTGAFGGLPASGEAVEVLRARGIDISGHRSQPLDPDKIKRADYVLTMTDGHLGVVRQLAPWFRGVACRIGNDDLEDPIGGDAGVYTRSADQIEAALKQRLEEIPL